MGNKIVPAEQISSAAGRVLIPAPKQQSDVVPDYVKKLGGATIVGSGISVPLGGYEAKSLGNSKYDLLADKEAGRNRNWRAQEAPGSPSDGPGDVDYSALVQEVNEALNVQEAPTNAGKDFCPAVTPAAPVPVAPAAPRVQIEFDLGKETGMLTLWYDRAFDDGTGQVILVNAVGGEGTRYSPPMFSTIHMRIGSQRHKVDAHLVARFIDERLGLEYTVGIKAKEGEAL